MRGSGEGGGGEEDRSEEEGTATRGSRRGNGKAMGAGRPARTARERRTERWGSGEGGGEEERAKEARGRRWRRREEETAERSHEASDGERRGRGKGELPAGSMERVREGVLEDEEPITGSRRRVSRERRRFPGHAPGLNQASASARRRDRTAAADGATWSDRSRALAGCAGAESDGPEPISARSDGRRIRADVARTGELQSLQPLMLVIYMWRGSQLSAEVLQYNGLH